MQKGLAVSVDSEVIKTFIGARKLVFLFLGARHNAFAALRMETAVTVEELPQCPPELKSYSGACWTVAFDVNAFSGKLNVVKDTTETLIYSNNRFIASGTLAGVKVESSDGNHLVTLEGNYLIHSSWLATK